MLTSSPPTSLKLSKYATGLVSHYVSCCLTSLQQKLTFVVYLAFTSNTGFLMHLMKYYNVIIILLSLLWYFAKVVITFVFGVNCVNVIRFWPEPSNFGSHYFFKSLVILNFQTVHLANFACRLLTGIKVTDIESAKQAIQCLHKMGAKTVIISSSELGSNKKVLICFASASSSKFILRGCI